MSAVAQTTTSGVGADCLSDQQLTGFAILDAQSVQLLIQLYNSIGQKMIQNATTCVTNTVNYALWTGNADCERRIRPCQLNVCDLIQILNQTPPSTTFAFNYNFAVRYLAFGLHKDGYFVPIGDSFFGGLNAAPDTYPQKEWRDIYEEVISNPMGRFIN